MLLFYHPVQGFKRIVQSAQPVDESALHGFLAVDDRSHVRGDPVSYTHLDVYKRQVINRDQGLGYGLGHRVQTASLSAGKYNSLHASAPP